MSLVGYDLLLWLFLNIFHTNCINLFFQSHGGFLTSAVLGNNNNVFDCGVAVAPVTDWRYYGRVSSQIYINNNSFNLVQFDW